MKNSYRKRGKSSFSRRKRGFSGRNGRVILVERGGTRL